MAAKKGVSKPKSSSAIYEKRVTKLVPLVSFMSRAQILQYVRKNTDWNVSNDQIDRYRQKAQERILEFFKEKQKTAIEDVHNDLRSLYMKALQTDDIKTCLSIIDRIMKITGIDKELSATKDTESNSLADIAKAIRETDG